MQNKKLILIGLNELNFEYIQKYIELGKLPNFKYLFEKFGYKETTSENQYELLEPWIQWVTLHTGKTYDEHQVFRLGDIVNRDDLEQLWEIAEKKGLSVGAISPFNVANRLENPKFFVPDPWTQTKRSGDRFVQKVAKAVAQAVNDNAKGGLNVESILSILNTYLRVVPLGKYTDYLSLASKIKSKVGIKAVILDKLLADLFLQQWKKHTPDFSSLFLNSGAHIQHHYMFNSLAYDGQLKNPDWYCSEDQDPLGLILAEYDKILGSLLKLNARFIIATGLHQQPHHHSTFYWRLKKHADFLQIIGLDDYVKVVPRMSRDFLVEFSEEETAKKSQDILLSFKSQKDDINIFSVDNRGKSLFVELTYPNEIKDNFTIVGHSQLDKFEDYIAFVAIKNGEHNGIGYVLDSEPNELPEQLQLKKVFDHIVSAL